MSYKAEDYTGPKEFSHLHCHSVYSTLDGVASVSQYAEACVERGYPGMALTEHGHMGSMPDLLYEFKKHKLKGVPACEIYFNDYEPQRKTMSTSIKELRENNREEYLNVQRNRHLTVLAKNRTGVSNLIKLTTQAYRTGFYYKPRIWFDKLLEYKEGLIILSGCLNGPVAHELRRTTLEGEPTPRYQSPDKRGAIDWVRKFKDAFKDDYYIELQMPGIPGDEKVFRDLIHIADKFKIKTILANDSHYMERKDYELQKIMMAVDQGLVLDANLDNENLFHVNSSEQYFKTRAELWERFKNNPYSKGIPDSEFESACDNTLEVIDKCDFIDVDSTPKILKLEEAEKTLKNILFKELKAKGLYDKKDKFLIDGKRVTYLEQMAIELDRIIDKGYSSYFLITHELIKYGKNKGYTFNPRGSASGSLVCYLLGISPIDSVAWGLSFDRFLAPSRGGFLLNVKMPK